MGANVINLDEYKSIETHWIALLWMVIKEEHLTMQYILIALESSIFWKNLKTHGKKNIITNNIEYKHTIR